MISKLTELKSYNWERFWNPLKPSSLRRKRRRLILIKMYPIPNENELAYGGTTVETFSQVVIDKFNHRETYGYEEMYE